MSAKLDVIHCINLLRRGQGQRTPECSKCKQEIYNFRQSDVTVSEEGDGIVKFSHECVRGGASGRIFACLECCKWSAKKPSQVRCSCPKKKKRKTEDTVSLENIQDEGDIQVNGQHEKAYDEGLDHDNQGGMDFDSDDAVPFEESPLVGELSPVDPFIVNYFNDSDLWPKASKKFFLREHRNKGDGKKGIIYNALIDKKQESDFGLLPEKEQEYHMHLTATFHSMQQSMIHNVTSANHYMVKEGVQKRKSEVDMMRECLGETLKDALTDALRHQDVDMDHIMQMANRSLDQKIMAKRKELSNEGPRINHPTDFNKVRNKYIEGVNSVEKNMPGPAVKEFDGFAWIPIESIISHMVALGYDILSFTEDSDWTNDDGGYDGTFFRDLHHKVKKMKKKSEIPDDARVLLLRLWSDGFQVHHIKVNNEHNNLQLFTITLMESKDCTTKKKLLTLPFALGFKKKDHSSILNKLLEEVKEMENWKLRYFGKERKMVPSLVYLQTVMQDYPEKCASSHSAQRGKYAHWWGKSSKFCPVRTPECLPTPSCPECETVRLERVLESVEDDIPGLVGDPSVRSLRYLSTLKKRNCDSCDDWWTSTDIIGGGIYPYKPGDELPEDFPPVVKLSFKMMRRAVENVKKYKATCERATKKQAKTYLALCCVAEKLAREIIDRIWKGEVPELPELWVNAEHYGIDLHTFVGLPMHGMTLGVEKALIPQVHCLFDRRKGGENTAWKGFLAAVHGNQESLKTVYMDWCVSMPFSGKEKSKMATANWQSEHYLAFTRLSLVHLGPLAVISEDMPGDKVPLFKAFQAMRVLWFCVMSHAFSDDKVPSGAVDDYIKLFLSACNRFHMLVQKLRNGGQVQADDQDQSDTENDVEKAGGRTPFFISKVNFLNLLNVSEAIDIYGSMRDIWEGPREGYIQFVKAEITSMRHNDQFMQTILKKLVTTCILEYMNEGNQLSNAKQYARKLNFKVYSSSTNLSEFFQGADMISGVVVHNKMYVCFDNQGSNNKEITLLPLRFDDKDGMNRYSLWYAPLVECSADDAAVLTCPSRDALPSMASDYFLSIPMIEIKPGKGSPLHTVLFRSWKIRDPKGRQVLLTPPADLLQDLIHD